MICSKWLGLISLMLWVVLPAYGQSSSQHRLSIRGLNLSSTKSQAVEELGKGFDKYSVGEIVIFDWPNGVIIETKGERILRIIGYDLAVDGKKIFADETDKQSLLKVFGKPAHTFYGHHGEPCLGWGSGLQVSAFGGDESREFGFFSLTSQPETPALEPISQTK